MFLSISDVFFLLGGRRWGYEETGMIQIMLRYAQLTSFFSINFQSLSDEITHRNQYIRKNF